MNNAVVIIGMGELGELFAPGFLRLGHPVVPILRGSSPTTIAVDYPEPALVLVAVGEHDLHPVLDDLPPAWRQRVGLLQNELLPPDWERHGISDPTVIVVWFDKKKGRPCVSVLPTRVAGPGAEWVSQCLKAVEVPCYTVPREELLYELALKSLYILSANIAGLRVGGTVGQLRDSHPDLLAAVAAEVLDVQEWRAGTPLPRARLLTGLLEGFAGDPDHICMGRSAPDRLRRALDHAAQAGIATPTLRDIAAGWQESA